MLESKVIQEFGPVGDSKQYRQWSTNLKNAPEQVRPNARNALDVIEQLLGKDIVSTERQGAFDNYKHAIIEMTVYKNRDSNVFEVLGTSNVDMWVFLRTKAEAEA